MLPTIARPLTPDVIDHVFRAIEDNPAERRRYEEFRDETPGGVHTVNAEVGRAVRHVLATDVIGRNKSPESGLIDSCSRLAVRPDMWPRRVGFPRNGPGSLPLAPTRGSSLNATSRPPSTNRRLVRYTVEVPTPTVLAMAASP